MVNKQSVSPPVPHLHALLTSGGDPPAEVDIFDLLKVSYEVSTHQGYLARPLPPGRVGVGVGVGAVAMAVVALCSLVPPYLTESPLAGRNSAA